MIDLERPPQNETRPEWGNWFEKAWNLIGLFQTYSRNIRISRPPYVYVDSSTIRVTASSTKPIYFVIAGDLYEVTTNLDLAVSGLSANSVYYIYAIQSAGVVSLVYDANGPDTGPAGYDDFSYIGAFSTNSSGDPAPFASSGGRHSVIGLAQTASLASTTALGSGAASVTFGQLPVTAFEVSMLCELVSTTDGNLIRVGPLDSSSCEIAVSASTGTGTGSRERNFFSIPILEPQTVYYRVSVGTDEGRLQVVGWREDPAQWP